MCDVPTGRGNKRFPKLDYFDDKDVGDKGVRGKSNFVDVAHANPLAVAERRLHSISSRVRERERLSHAIMAAIQFRERRKKKEGV